MQIFSCAKPFCIGKKFVTLARTALAKNQYFRNICTFSDTKNLQKHLVRSKEIKTDEIVE